MKNWLASFLACLMAASGCMKTPQKPVITANPHYVLGDPYQVAGHWYYPAENYALDTTGIAAILPGGTRKTTDGEIFNGGALEAAMPTIQLPAIARVTNLENGREILVRVNDRGAGDPARAIALSPRAAALLLINGAARVRIRIDTRLSHDLVDQVGGGPKLAIATAAPTTVTAESLPPIGQSAAHGPGTTIAAGQGPQAQPTVPDPLPEQVYLVGADPGQLWLRAGTFGRYDYANVLAARLGGLGGTVLRSREGRQETYAVRAGPFPTIPAADAALRRALAAGVVDARITVEDD
jgi:rare lipoprotein A